MSLINEDHNWNINGKKINANENNKIVEKELEKGPIIVEHWFYCGSSAPDRLFFEDFQSYEGYIESNTNPGDDIWVWSFADLCTENQAIVNGKCPDNKGRVPESGAY